MNFYEIPQYLMSHQKDGVKTARRHARWGYWYDTGTGKTLMSLEIGIMHGGRILVICPLSIVESAWMEDIKKFHPEINALNLWKEGKKKGYKKKLEDAHIVIINYESFKKYQSDLTGFNTVIIDESSKIKESKSKITKTVTAYCAKHAGNVYLLSGTPAPNNPMEYFSQIKIINPYLFGQSYYKFRLKYCEQFGYGGFQWGLKPERTLDFFDEIASLSSVVRKEDVLDLPERTDNIRDVALSADEKRVYKTMLTDYISEIGNNIISASNAVTKLMKLRQITSGFILDEAGISEVIGRSKLSILADLLDDIGSHQIIIWHQFRKEADFISDLLEKRGASFGICNGSVKQAQKDEYIREFKAGKLQYILAHPRTLAHGVTLTNCSYAVYFSLSYSHEEHYQSRDRIYRKGQKNACSYFYLTATGTIDKIIMKALKNKENMEQTVLEFIKNKGKTYG